MQLGTALINQPGIIGNAAVLILPEDFVQHGDRNQPAMYHLIQYVAGSYAGKLVHIAYQYNFRIPFQPLKKLAHQPHIYKRNLIHNNKVSVQKTGFSFPAALILLTDDT